MKQKTLAFVTCAGLLMPGLQNTLHASERFIETTLCTTGQVIRISLGGSGEEAPPNPKQHACHALCTRDQEDEESKTT